MSVTELSTYQNFSSGPLNHQNVSEESCTKNRLLDYDIEENSQSNTYVHNRKCENEVCHGKQFIFK